MLDSRFSRLALGLVLALAAACGGSGEESPKATEFTLSYSAGNGGRLEGETSQLVEEGQSGTPVTAIAEVGHSFDGWNDGVLSPTRVDGDVRADLSVHAQFSPNEYAPTYLAADGGSIEGEAEQLDPHGLSGTTLPAGPEAGYVFNRWSDGLGTPARTDSNVQGDLTVTAEFIADDVEPAQHTLTYLAGAGGSIVGISPQIVDEGAAGSE